MPSLEREEDKVIKERLTAYTGSLQRLAELSKVSRVTVWEIKTGATKNPGIGTVKALEAALDQLEAGTAPTDEQKAEQVGWEMGMDRETAARLANN